MQLSFAEIANMQSAVLEPENAEGNVSICATLAHATEDCLSFCTDKQQSGAARTTKAGLVFVPKDFSGWVGNAKAIIRVESPFSAIIACANLLNKKEFNTDEIHKTAQISKLAFVEGSVGENSVIGAFCVVPKGAVVKANCILESSVSLYPNVEIGSGSHLHSGAVIGSRGFGFYELNGERLEIPHFGGVHIGENCEIGPQCVVAAGFLEPTKLGNNCKLDSFVQIGHNCIVGNNAVFCSQSGLAGSVIAEDNITLAGGAQVAGHLTLGKNCSIAAKAGVTKSVPANATFAGFPARPIEEWRRRIAKR